MLFRLAGRGSMQETCAVLHACAWSEGTLGTYIGAVVCSMIGLIFLTPLPSWQSDVSFAQRELRISIGVERFSGRCMQWHPVPCNQRLGSCLKGDLPRATIAVAGPEQRTIVLPLSVSSACL